MRDLLIWNDALTTGRIPGGAALVKLLEERAKLTDGTTIGYALGLQHDDYRGIHEIGHGGATAGYRTHLARWPDRGLSVAVFCNAASADPGSFAHRVADVVLGLPTTTTTSAETVVSGVDLAPLTGTYRDTTTDQIVILTARDSGLFASAGGPPTRLAPLGGGRFRSEVAGEFRFAPGNPSGGFSTSDNNGRRSYLRQGVVDTATLRLSDFTGAYRSPELDVTYRVTVNGDRLELKNGYRPALRMNPIYPDGFRSGPATLRFMRDGDGRIVGFRVFAGRARDVRFERIP
jgi:hypothetical protein